MSAAIVLLSGGLDSVAALLWARGRYQAVHALSADYAQPARDQELAAAQSAADALGVPWERLHLSRAVRASGLLAGHVHDGDGLHPANVPGRNLVLCAVATAHGCVLFGGAFDVVIGANADDAAGFPDCRPDTLEAQADALRMGTGRLVRIVAPWAWLSKAGILRAVAGDPMVEIVHRSWSCYRQHGPCGDCSACHKRAAAFDESGAVDLCKERPLCGGDPGRDRAAR